VLFYDRQLSRNRTIACAACHLQRLAFTDQLLRCRMYHGWADMWEGCTNSVYAGLDYRPDRVA